MKYLSKQVVENSIWMLQTGEVHIEDGKVKPEPIKKFSLYGEEI